MSWCFSFGLHSSVSYRENSIRNASVQFLVTCRNCSGMTRQITRLDYGKLHSRIQMVWNIRYE
ncbi:hypothetical protein AG1IA_03679 [Rhizoctonia solani AG-1 IA]|uniref:Uncharacterized protein n=1 Tax=Thanatephorus cucumeris (strain AG1-IA) TaxID=983506 RepID=L8X119_THACA|nr:hypothetical protein AG1IA_03679 [Rhizoctonia solani AG-1 IA]